MQNVGIGDVIFIILILGVVHGIMTLVSHRRKRDMPPSDLSEDN